MSINNHIKQLTQAEISECLETKEGKTIDDKMLTLDQVYGCMIHSWVT